MASTSKIKGVILKITDTPGKDKLITVLTERGVFKAFMTPKRTAGKKSHTVDLFTYGEIVYFTTDSGNNLINSITPEEYFFGIREDITRLYAAGYFSSLALHTAEDAETDMPRLMQLVCTSFSMLSKGANVKDIKPAFEFYIAELLGFTPSLEASVKSTSYYFSIPDGLLYVNPVPNSVLVSRNVVMAIYKIIMCAPDKALSVVCDEKDDLYHLAQQYILYHTERNFDTLKYLNGVI